MQRRVTVSGLSAAAVASLPQAELSEPGGKIGQRRLHWSGSSLSSPTTMATPSEANRLLASLPSSCTGSTLSASETEEQVSSSRGALSVGHEERWADEMPEEITDEFSADSDEEAADPTLPLSPSKSARRRLRRRRQAQAIKAAAEHEQQMRARGAAWAANATQRAPRAVVTLEDIGLGLLSPGAGGSSSSRAQVATGDLQMSSLHSAEVASAATPCGMAAEMQFNMASAPTPCRSTWTAPLGTSPLQASSPLRRGVGEDAAERILFMTQNPSLNYSHPYSPHTAVATGPLAAPPVAPVSATSDAMRLLFGNVAPPAPEVLEAQLRVAAPDVYED